MVRVEAGDAFKDAPRVARDVRENGGRPVLVTDPPFNVGYRYKSYIDRKPEAEYYKDLANLIRRFDGAVIVHYPEALDRLSIELGEAPTRRVAWVYPSNTKRQHRDIAYYGIKPDFSRVRQPYRDMHDKRCIELYKRAGGAKSWDWIEANQVKNCSKEKTAHPCQMLVSVMSLAVGILPEGVTVIDPFAGSGTTLVACQQRGIKAYGFDTEPVYVDIAMRRLSQGVLELGD